jgi:hypothetical protein
VGPRYGVEILKKRKLHVFLVFPAVFVESLTRLGCFVLSFGRFLPDFSMYLMENDRPEEEAAAILRNDGII